MGLDVGLDVGVAGGGAVGVGVAVFPLTEHASIIRPSVKNESRIRFLCMVSPRI
jgi:hypothetical protein